MDMLQVNSPCQTSVSLAVQLQEQLVPVRHYVYLVTSKGHTHPYRSNSKPVLMLMGALGTLMLA